jgi:hypothetical protein
MAAQQLNTQRARQAASMLVSACKHRFLYQHALTFPAKHMDVIDDSESAPEICQFSRIQTLQTNAAGEY